MRAVLILLVGLAACGPTPGEEAMAEMADAMRAQTDMVERGVALEEIFERRCTDDCSGHRAGYLYAVQFQGNNPPDCDTESVSFREGCEMGRRLSASNNSGALEKLLTGYEYDR